MLVRQIRSCIVAKKKKKNVPTRSLSHVFRRLPNTLTHNTPSPPPVCCLTDSSISACSRASLRLRSSISASFSRRLASSCASTDLSWASATARASSRSFLCFSFCSNSCRSSSTLADSRSRTGVRVRPAPLDTVSLEGRADNAGFFSSVYSSSSSSSPSAGVACARGFPRSRKPFRELSYVTSESLSWPRSENVNALDAPSYTRQGARKRNSKTEEKQVKAK